MESIDFCFSPLSGICRSRANQKQEKNHSWPESLQEAKVRPQGHSYVKIIYKVKSHMNLCPYYEDQRSGR